MTKTLIACAAALLATPAAAFDRPTVAALQACHDHLRTDASGFADLPEAAVTVFPGTWDGDRITVFWNVTWTDPDVRAAGRCTTVAGVVEAVEDYTAD